MNTNDEALTSHSYRSIIAIFILLLSCLTASPLPGQSLPTLHSAAPVSLMSKWTEEIKVDLDFRSAPMEELLNKIHEETGVSLLMDDVPLGAETNLKFRGSLKDALDQISNAFDYVWYSSKKLPRTILFQKRFQSLEEHPQWHRQEMLQIASEVCRALENRLYVPGPAGRPRELLQILYHKLDSTQLARLYRGEALPVTDLNPVQTLLLHQSIYSTALKGMTDGWIKLKDRLSQLEHAQIEMHLVDGFYCLTLKLPSSEPIGEAINLRFYNPVEVDATGDRPETIPTEPHLALQTVVKPDQVNDTPNPLNQKLSLQVHRINMKELVKGLTTCCHCEISVEASMEEHRLSAWIKARTLQSFLDGMAELNEWKWRYDQISGIAITRPRTFTPSTYTEVSSALAMALPPDYRHFLGWGISAEDWLKNDESAATQAFRKIPGGEALAVRHRLSTKIPQDAEGDTAASRIWPTVPKALRHKQKKVYPYQEWSPEVKEQVLWTLMMAALREAVDNGRDLDVMEGRLTPYERQPDIAQVRLEGKRNGEFSLFGYGVDFANPDGKHVLMGTYWDLSKARASMSAYLQKAFEAY